MSIVTDPRFASLDISVLTLSAVCAASGKKRLDPKHYCKSALKARALISKHNHVEFSTLTETFRKGIFDIKAETYTEPGDGVPFVRIGDLKDGLINESNLAWISEKAHKAESSTALSTGDLVLSKTAYPAASLVTVPRCNVSQDTIAIRLSGIGKSQVRASYISVFLNTPLGIALMDAEFQGNVQEHLSLPDARRLPIPLLSDALQNKIEVVVHSAVQERTTARKLLAQAEAKLLGSIGLVGWMPPNPLTYAVSSKIVRTTRRLDAQFYSPRIEQLRLKLGKAGTTIGDVASARHERFDDTKQGSFDYIEIGDIREDGTADSTTLPRADAPSRANWHVHKDDVITSTVRPIRRLSALIDANQHGYVCSSGFVVLQPTKAKPEVLLTYLRLPLVCELMDLYSSASMYPAIAESDLLKLPFIAPASEDERSVCKLVRDARKSRAQSEALLDCAHQAVQIALESSEAEAIALLDGQQAVSPSSP